MPTPIKLSIKKNCPKGSRRIPAKTGNCIPNVKNVDKNPNVQTKNIPPVKPSSVDVIQKLTRCKKGFHRKPPKTGICVEK